MTFTFKDKTIELYSIGEVLGNDIKFKGILKNRLIPPYYVESAELNTKKIDLNYLINKLKTAQVSENNAIDSFQEFNIANFVIKNLKLHAKEVKLRNLSAENVEAVINIFN